MYLFIFEDGEMSVGNTLSDGDYDANSVGVLDIVRTVTENTDIFYEQYFNGKWHRIDALEPKS